MVYVIVIDICYSNKVSGSIGDATVKLALQKTDLLNILVMRCVIQCVYMLEWMRKEKHRIGTPRIRGLRGSV